MATTGSDVANGQTVGTAVRTIQVGISNALFNGWTDIYVGQGLYTPGSGLNAVGLGRGVIVTNNNMRLRGGWDVSFSAQSGTTLLDGTSTLTNVIWVSNAANIMIDNFTVIRGNALGARPWGGGLYLSAVTNGLFTNLIVLSNSALIGGGVFLQNAAGNRLSMQIVSNTTTTFGGGLCCYSVMSNTISGIINKNFASGAAVGGGLYLQYSSANLIAADIRSNVSSSDGGGVSSLASGGGMDSNTFTGTIANNTSSSSGGGAWIWGNWNTFTGPISSNQASSGGGGIHVEDGDSNNFYGDFIGNSASSSLTGGGGLQGYGRYNTLTGNFVSNTTAGQGGGARLTNIGNVVTGNFYSNSASGSIGGGLVFLGSGTTITGNFVGNKAQTIGGAIYLLSNSTSIGVSGTFISNTATAAMGGAIFQGGNRGNFTGTFYSNASGGQGGAIAMYGQGSNTVNAGFHWNRGASSGGAIYFSQCHSNAISGTWTSNSCTGNGGAFMFSGSSSNVVSGTFISNASTSTGGAISSLGNNNSISGTFINNYVSVNWGGGIELLGDMCSFSGTMVGNSCAKWGGGLMVSGKSNTVNGNFYGNTSVSGGGALYISGGFSNTITGFFDTNSASSGIGGAFFGTNCHQSILNLSIDHSTAGVGGGALFIGGSHSNTISLAVLNSSSGGSGGGVYSFSCYSNLFSGSVMNCSANGHGGGYYFADGRSNAVYGAVQSNYASGNGAGILSFAETNTFFGASVSSNFAVGNGGGFYDQNGSSNGMTSLLLHNRALGIGGAVYLLNANAFAITNTGMSNNNSTLIDSVIALSNTGLLTNLVISNTAIGGVAGNSAFGILETGNNIANHVLATNSFLINTLGYLYSNIGGSVLSNVEFSILNTAGNTRHNAGTAFGNYPSPPLQAAASGFAGPFSWVTNIPAAFSSTATPGNWVITNYKWNFGDGVVTQGAALTSLTHVYTNFLSDFVTLTVYDTSGSTNAYSNSIQIYLYSLLGGLVDGTVSNAVLISMNSAVTQAVTNTLTNGVYVFVVTNNTYTLTPSKLGYRFTPVSTTVVLNNTPSTNNNFTARDIYPILTFKDADGASYADYQKVVRDLPLRVESDAPEILSTVSYNVQSMPGTPTFSTNFAGIPYGTNALLDTTRYQDGDYKITATAVDTVFSRTHTGSVILHFDNQLFKILDKGLENLKAITYDTIRTIGKDTAVELFFYIPSDQTVRIDLYNKLGRLLRTVSSQKYFHGHNRVVMPMDIIPPNFPSGPYYLHFHTPSSSDIDKSVLLVITR